MPNVTHRINEFIEFKNLSINKFEMICGISQSKVSKAIKNETEFGFTVLQQISQKFPELSMHYIITGMGDMVIKEEYLAFMNQTHIEFEETSNEELKKEIENLKLELLECLREKTRLEKLLSNQKKTTQSQNFSFKAVMK